MDKKLLDNMTGQEIKEMIDNEIIDLNELDNTTLAKVLNFEIDMLCLGTGDMKTIRECSRLLNERNTSDKLNDDQIMSIVDKTETEYVTIVRKDSSNNHSVAISQKQKYFSLRKIGLIAAIAVLMIAATALMATAFGFDLLSYFREVVGLPAGSAIEKNGIVFVHDGKSTKYSSIEELMETENLKIIYPFKMTDDIYIKQVQITEGISSNKEITITTNDIGTYIVVYVGYDYSMPSFEQIETLVLHDHTYYIRKNENIAFCYFENNYYFIKAKNYDDLITIIKNMTE